MSRCRLRPGLYKFTATLSRVLVSPDPDRYLGTLVYPGDIVLVLDPARIKDVYRVAHKGVIGLVNASFLKPVELL